MAASVTFSEYNGAGSTRSADISTMNFGSTDASDLTPASYPIQAGSYSYEKYFKVDFGGTFNYVGSLFWYKSAGAYQTDEVINCTGSQTAAITYATPTDSASSKATAPIGTSLPSTMTIQLGENDSVTGSLTAAGSTNYFVMQTETSASTEPGDVNQKTFTLQWTES